MKTIILSALAAAAGIYAEKKYQVSEKVKKFLSDSAKVYVHTFPDGPEVWRVSPEDVE
jgi:hypothetical protein